jgi:A/G-specific adenine glycosylase
VQKEHGGRLPQQYTALRELPGLGAYTAAAVASIAFDEAVPAVDGNVERVLTRVFALEGDPKRSATARSIREAAQTLIEEQPPHLITQALMELGALLCLPRNPSCEICPWAKECRAHREEQVDKFPERAAARRIEEVAAYAAILRKGEKWLWRRRPAGGHNEGLWELPTTAWHPGEMDESEARSRLTRLGREYHAEWRVREALVTVKHSITFHRITLTAFAVAGEVEESSQLLRWASFEEARSLGLTAAAVKLSRKLAK